ncbi:PepSY domain-containing protein [Massilia atriviolacea]|uniref:PepSY domain-containing protein n=1 Tax=Massilia atriviolacea TaxID=2495579 RepID=A0A430HSE4_9BURK|nr:PepSY domain-containing protein [Massilia atriviolacea]RSZ60440.1 PepSY domain-containing protein [Massilia atriviolacea]
MGSSFKRLLFLGHRWLGIVLCLFFAMWFVSGVVMMYVGYPKLTDAERLRHLPALQGGAPLLGPQQAMAVAGLTGPFKDLRLAAASGGRAVYLVQPAGAQRGAAAIAVDAHSGARVAVTDEARAMASAAAFAGPGVGARYLGTVDEDAFTHSRGLDGHRPLHRVQLADPGQTLLYVSGRTGEVVRDAPRAERLWNYAGAWLHWLYPLRGNAFDPYWADIVNWLAIAGTVMVLSGATVGLLRWRFKAPYRSGSRSPYPGAMMRWHHIGGLLFGLVTATWIFSGLMSMNPWRIFDGGAAPLRMQALEGSALLPSALDAAPAALLAAAGPGIRELRWTRVLGKTLVLAQPGAGAPLVLDAHSGRPAALDASALLAAARALLPDPVASVERLDAYDLYYYSRDAHSMTGGSGKPLPVWRIAYADPHQSWVYLDPHTGALAGRSDRHKRASRWLFAMLHSWDWLPLLERRPLWDMVLVALSLGGALMSVTGVVLGWRRLGRKLGAAGGTHARVLPRDSSRPA